MALGSTYAAKERITYCGAKEAITAFFEIMAKRIAVCKAIDVSGEAAFIGKLDNVQLRVMDGRVNLAAVADDVAVLHEIVRVNWRHTGNLTGVKAVERTAKRLALIKHGAPGKPRLKAFETQLLKQRVVAVFSFSEFVVVIIAHQLIAAARPAASVHGLILSHVNKTVNIFMLIC